MIRIAVTMTTLLAAGMLLGGCESDEPPAEAPTTPAPVADGEGSAPASPPLQRPPEAKSELTNGSDPQSPPPLTPPAPPELTAPTTPTPTIKTPWADVQVGTTVKMKNLGGMMMTMEVIKLDAQNATIRTTVHARGGEPITNEMTMPRYAPPGGIPADTRKRGRSLGKRTIDVAGQPLACDVWETVATMGDKTITTRTYTNKGVPGWTVKIESDAIGQMQTISEVVEYSK